MGTTPGATLTVTAPTRAQRLAAHGHCARRQHWRDDRLILSGPAAIASGRTTLQITNLNGLAR
jgi:hypothetical protein